MRFPTCEKDLPTEQGMRQHHTKVHGDRLPNRTCVDCGVEFYRAKAQRKFCYDCNPQAGENNGNWRGAKETAECKLCGSEFEYYPSDKKGVYCPECVESADGLLPENPMQKIDRIATSCGSCGAELRVLESRLQTRKRGVFCNLACYGDWLSKNVVGQAHHQWEGGDIPYGGSWWSVRREALDRDDHTCQRCGKGRGELNREPDVHHIDRVRDFEDPADAHRLENVISLCRSCHRRVEAGELVAPRPTKRR